MADGAPKSAGPAASPDVVRALRAAALTGLIAFGLFLPLIGFITVQNIRNELILETRWPLLLTLVALIAGMRFLHALVIAPWLERRAARPRVDQAIPAWRAMIARWATPFALGFV